MIFISKLHECASVSLSMCFFSIFFTACSLFLLKLPFLSQKVSIFISKLHEHTFVFLLSLSKVKHLWCISFLQKASILYAFFFPIFCFFTACSLFLLKLSFLSQSFDFYLQTPWTQVCFLALSQKASIFASIPLDVVLMCFVFPPRLLLHFLFFTSICICMRFFFCFFIACSLFLLKLSFLSQKTSIFISKLHEHRFVFLLSL